MRARRRAGRQASSTIHPASAAPLTRVDEGAHSLFIEAPVGVNSVLVRRPAGSGFLARTTCEGADVAAARFMVVQGVFVHDVPVPEWPGPGGATVRADSETTGGWTSWRLLGPNQRELGRAARVFPDVERCLADATNVTARLDTAVMALSARASRWTWELTLEGTIVAVASRLYLRQRECEYNSRVFLVTAPSAQPLSTYVVPHPRLDLELGATTE